MVKNDFNAEDLHQVAGDPGGVALIDTRVDSKRSGAAWLLACPVCGAWSAVLVLVADRGAMCGKCAKDAARNGRK